MEQKIFCIYDLKAKSYRFPMVMSHTGQAVRQFTTLANNAETEVGMYPSEFALMELGFFNDETGMVQSLSAPVNLGLASSYVREVKNA